MSFTDSIRRKERCQVVDSVPARLKLLLTGKIFVDLLRRQFLPRSGLHLRGHLLFPPGGFQLTRRSRPMKLAAKLLAGDSLVGDDHVFGPGRANETAR
jgi:hypothetical protein